MTDERDRAPGGAVGGGDASGSSAGEAHVLVVEDDHTLRHLAERLLGRNGFTVTTARDATDAIEILGSGAPIDLVVSDVVMPGMDGVALAGWIAAHHPALGVILVSGYVGADAIGTRTLPAGMLLLQKPYSSAQLIAAIREVLRDEGAGRGTA